MMRSFSSLGMRPCSASMRLPANSGFASIDARVSVHVRRRCGRPSPSSAGGSSRVGLLGLASSIAGHTTNAWRPCASSSASRSHTRATQPGFSASGTTWDAMPCAPGRQLRDRRDVEVAEHRHRDRARDRRRREHEHVRRPRALEPQRLALVDAEAVLLVDDDEPEVEELDVVAEQRVRADHDGCRPRHRRERRLALLRDRQLAGEQRRPQLAPRGRDRACARSSAGAGAASTSVGASSADCPPDSATASIARSATSVLPEPTSPCTSRFIGTSAARSLAISAPTSRWSPVSSNGSAASKPSRIAPGSRAVAAVARSRARCCSSAACSTNASWKRSALRAAPQSASFCGRWMSSSARAYGRRSRAVAHGLGHRVVQRRQRVEHDRDRLLRSASSRRRRSPGRSGWAARPRPWRPRHPARLLRHRPPRTARSRDARAAATPGSRRPCPRRCRARPAAARSRARPG